MIVVVLKGTNESSAAWIWNQDVFYRYNWLQLYSYQAVYQRMLQGSNCKNKVGYELKKVYGVLKDPTQLGITIKAMGNAR